MGAKDELVLIRGHTYTLIEASQKFRIPWSTIRQRYFHHDRVERLIRPTKKITVTIEHERFTLGKLAMRYRLNPGTVKGRYYAGKRGQELIRTPTASHPPYHRRRNRHPIQFHGHPRTFPSLSDEYGIECGTLRGRYYRGDRDDKLVRPLGKNLRQSRAPLHIKFNGGLYTFKELSRTYHLSVNIIRCRYYQGKRGKGLVRPRQKHFG